MERAVFENTVAASVARITGISPAAAAELVTKSREGALKVADLRYLIYKGPDYWAERIVNGGRAEQAPATART